MAQASLTCSRCSERHPAARMAWVTALGWCCRVHAHEEEESVLIEFFSWCLSRPPHGRPSATTDLERHALYLAGLPEHARVDPAGLYDRGAEWMEYRGDEE